MDLESLGQVNTSAGQGRGRDTGGKDVDPTPKSLQVVLTVGLYRKDTAWCMYSGSYGKDRIPHILKKREICFNSVMSFLPAQTLPGYSEQGTRNELI